MKSGDAINCRWRHGCPNRPFTKNDELSASNADSTLRIVKEHLQTQLQTLKPRSLAQQPGIKACIQTFASQTSTGPSRINKSKWWRMTGSNRRPPACKAGALPAELIPQSHNTACRMDLIWLVGLVGFEPTTPALSRRCSNRLSYRPNCLHSCAQSTADKCGCLIHQAALSGPIRFTSVHPKTDHCDLSAIFPERR